MSTHPIDVAAWDEETQVPLLQTVISALLFDAGITYAIPPGLSVARVGDTCTVTVPTPSNDPTAALSQSAVETKRDAQATALAAANAASATEVAARATEKAGNALGGLTFAQIDARVDAYEQDLADARAGVNGAGTLAAVKPFLLDFMDTEIAITADLQRLLRFLRCKGVLDKNGV